MPERRGIYERNATILLILFCAHKWMAKVQSVNAIRKKAANRKLSRCEFDGQLKNVKNDFWLADVPLNEFRDVAVSVVFVAKT